MKKIVLFLYQWIIFGPLFFLLTLLTALLVMAMAPLFGSRFWGYYPPRWWSRLTCWLALCRVKSRGHEKLDPRRSYIFVANHQGAFDIFLVYGFLNQNVKWMQKQSLRKIPFVGFASEKAGHVFVDNTNVAKRTASIEKAKEQIVDGVSMVVFPEGSRSHTGKMGPFKRGAYHIALDLKLPIVPLTVNGPYDVLKRNTLRLHPSKMELIIHEPIPTEGLTESDIPELISRSRKIIYDALWEKYK
ncbi:lysophospholipid acyltransferase family protein [Proteiniphilum sp. UBA1028]|uniref:lysophospholipid acyltransferase family protein n=1 Tax=Proteiniphilum sp. UBA1028 TaxID=1947251 RepID=UPI000E9BD738|nr:lysophospholipid acyltransferase family protein [Proteiniphilum sp. UBA1028]HBG56451.1 1-acyl-sn-glycerol-3-phosphate acyltransferase [Porphyromonadaceae bacterium]